MAMSVQTEYPSVLNCRLLASTWNKGKVGDGEESPASNVQEAPAVCPPASV